MHYNKALPVLDVVLTHILRLCKALKLILPTTTGDRGSGEEKQNENPHVLVLQNVAEVTMLALRPHSHPHHQLRVHHVIVYNLTRAQ